MMTEITLDIDTNFDFDSTEKIPVEPQLKIVPFGVKNLVMVEIDGARDSIFPTVTDRNDRDGDRD